MYCTAVWCQARVGTGWWGGPFGLMTTVEAVCKSIQEDRNRSIAKEGIYIKWGQKKGWREASHDDIEFCSSGTERTLGLDYHNHQYHAYPFFFFSFLPLILRRKRGLVMGVLQRSRIHEDRDLGRDGAWHISRVLFVACMSWIVWACWLGCWFSIV